MSSNESPQDLSQLEEEISNFFEDFFYDRGGSPLLGRIYSLCVLATPIGEKSLTQQDFVEKFNVNPSTISRNLKDLENWDLIDRRREPGSREWQYQMAPTSFLELFVNQFETTILVTLKERGDDLKRIRAHWGQTLSEESRKTEKGARILEVLDLLLNWIDLVENELTTFVERLHERFLELNKPKLNS